MATTANVTLDDKVSAKVIALYEQGDRLIDITKATGVPRASIYWVLRKAGITPSRMPKPSGEMMSVHEVLDRLRQTEREIGHLRAECDQKDAVIAHLNSQLEEYYRTAGRRETAKPAKKAPAKAAPKVVPAAKPATRARKQA